MKTGSKWEQAVVLAAVGIIIGGTLGSLARQYFPRIPALLVIALGFGLAFLACWAIRRWLYQK